MRGPGDRVGLPGAGGVLDQPVGTRPGSAGRGEQPLHGVPLVEAREECRGLAGAPAVGVVPALDVHEIAEQTEPGVALPDPLPQVRRVVAVWIGRITGAALVPGAAGALVERQESRLLTGEAGAHVDLARVDGEVHQRAGAEDQVGRIAVALVLPDRVPDALLGERVLQLGRRGRDSVDEERQVDRVARAWIRCDAAGVRRPAGWRRTSPTGSGSVRWRARRPGGRRRRSSW